MQGKAGSNAVSKRPAGAGGSSGSAPSSGSKRPGGAVKRYSGGGGAARAGGAAGQGGIWRYYTDDAAGLKVGPTTVLVVSLLFIALVVMLHIFGRFARSR
mmetsp:Transcript_10884/g.17121  ORF Transcript_10884/g.17121 Transcript_10884/m.17121 type:complete len:100 (-) Transcript_10884:325-624(-)